MHACADGCASWEYTDGTCTHNPDVPLTAHAVGSYCGVKGSGWALSQDKKAMTWTQKPEAVGPSMGTITLRPSVSTSTTASASAADDDATGGAASVSFGAADDPAKLFEEFSSDGKFSAGNAASGAVAASGAASASATVPAGETVTLSIVFAWYFPDRDYKANSDKTTDGIILGNMYQNLWSGSEEVAAALASEERLASIVGDINAHHQVVAHVDNPTPVWLKDMLLNQFSHYHMFMWYKDGRMREYEAWSCDDVDSVHNDYQRHLLYIWAFPEFETQKMEAWGSWAQDPKDGHVFECLAGFGHGPLDKPTGRYMVSKNGLFLSHLYIKNAHFTKTGSGQTYIGKAALKKDRSVPGRHECNLRPGSVRVLHAHRQQDVRHQHVAGCQTRDRLVHDKRQRSGAEHHGTVRSPSEGHNHLRSLRLRKAPGGDVRLYLKSVFVYRLACSCLCFCWRVWHTQH
jgi:hypothetical protein